MFYVLNVTNFGSIKRLAIGYGCGSWRKMKERLKNFKENTMELNEYQKQAMTTCLPASENGGYMLLNLVGEVGEFCSKVAKHIRKGEMTFGAEVNPNDLQVTDKLDNFFEADSALEKEAGDILWQLSGLCTVMGWSLEDVARHNLEKLAARKQNGTIAGSGDGVTKEERK